MKKRGNQKKGRIITRKRIKIFIIVFCLLLVGSFGVVSYEIGINVADGLVYFNKGNDTKANSRKQLAMWGYDIEGFEKQFQGKRIDLTAEDDNKVPVVFFSADDIKDNNTVILVHGLGGDYVSVYPQAEMYLENGWNVLALDQRGSGDSSNEKMSFGYYEKLDVKAVVDYVKANTKDKKIVVHGFSMGAVTTGLYAETEHAENNVDAIILDSAFDSMESMFLSSWDNMNTGLPGEYAVWCGNWALNMKYGFGFDDANMLLALKNCDIPTLVIQGQRDEVSTMKMGEEIFESIKGSKKEYWLVDTKHVEAYMDYPLQYKERVMNFIN
ncbi:alpha/beta hydrolase [Oceanirhabdus seepicola]|uniref:Alpha/beta hydrolase n=1 Tax=Oceanirhabdus seepicola TaxID=2828781 RepID=A0A9J6NX65_9CLOT|nr:alpha/beta hydrolase [Oceanirhabdus seepicola]MCM1989103.1 alpha/beta hydrolase [Oceanirhabdus seepicola]